jgi:hypothetical protein
MINTCPENETKVGSLISDARTATYVILSIGSGPGGRRFKSFRPDHLFKTNNLRHAKERETAWCKTRRSAFRFHRADRSNSRWRRGLAPRRPSCQFQKLSELVHHGSTGFERIEEPPRSALKAGIQPRPQVTEKHGQNCRIRDQAVG